MTLSSTYTNGFVISKDGTKIGYRQLGNGPGLILVPGGLMASQNFMELAKELSNEFTVYVPDRRGRGLSENNPKTYGLKEESEDIQAIMYQTNTTFIFGLSSGAIITLQTAIATAAVKKIAIFEPPLTPDGIPFPFVKKYESAMAAGNYGKAMLSIINGTTDSLFFKLVPAFLTAPFLNVIIKADAQKDKGNDVSLQKLIYAFKYDDKIVVDSTSIIDACKNITAEVLLIGGEKSKPFLRNVLDILTPLFKYATRIELPGVGHTAANNSDNPKLVADALKKFFKDSGTK